jgi:2-phospho-L-lactate guanylyltransferase
LHIRHPEWRGCALNIDVLVPVKGSPGGKGRLAGLLSPEERAALVRAMLRDVVAAPLHSPAVRTVAVTSRDADILELTRSLGALPLLEPPHSHGLNAALEAAIATLARDGADAVLILQGDVPEVGPDDVSALLAGIAASGPPLVRAAPTADGGTSALMLYPPKAISFAFGPESFARHQQAARAAAVPFERCDLPALAVDIDRPEDLAHLLTSGHAPHTRAALIAAGLPERLAWG